ncbi:MAG: hypothetical protein IKC46_03410 [Lachnospiraceae bacterium]|nr:hypothetical protein [Lachnospiraceae bacterium]
MNLYGRYEKLKKQVGGNREVSRNFHDMNLLMVEDNMNITKVPKHIERILAELLFAMKLSDRLEGKYEKEVTASLELLENSMEEDGVLSKAVCRKAEEILLPMESDAKTYEVLFASHAHIDMNWQWGWQETVAITLSSFRTMLNLMQEYPEFTYSQSQASTYKIVEEYDPAMMEEIKARIAEGRWEVTANAWVETDKNMPDTESLIRHISITRDYLRDVWGVENIKVDFSPDTFGHSRFVPEINNFGNVPYYYHCRGVYAPGLHLYRYKAPSGKEILVYKEFYWYNSRVHTECAPFAIECEKMFNGLKTALIVYGVGNHGGGPSRRDIENILEMQKWPVFPVIKFGTLHEFFEKAESVRDTLPVLDSELNFIFDGCFTTQSRVKLGNRRAEAGLLDSEKMSALSHFTLGTDFLGKHYSKAWEGVLFNHFHDILTGSGVQETREYAMGKFADAIATAQTQQAKAYETISRNVDTTMYPYDDDIADTTSESAGVGYAIKNYAGVPNPERGAGKCRIYTVFNPTAVKRDEVVELTVWDYTGKMNQLEMIDQNGNPLEFQIICGKDRPFWYWGHNYFRVMVKMSVEPFGYTTCALYEKETTDYKVRPEDDRGNYDNLPKGLVTLENSRLCAKFDTGSGMVLSLTDKKTGEEMLAAPAGLYLVETQEMPGTAWQIGRHLKTVPVTDTYEVAYSRGKVRDSVTFKQKVMHSDVTMTIALDKDADALSYDLKVDWHEIRQAQANIPLLTFRVPLKNGSDCVQRDVPAGTAVTKADYIDIPALTGICAVTDQTTLALMTDCKYGMRFVDNTLSVSLINTSYDPDPYPERGIHAIKVFVKLTDGNPVQLKYDAERLTRPMIGVPTGYHDGKLAAEGSLLGFEAAGTVISSIFVSADDALTIRMYETMGKEDKVTVRVPFEVSKAVMTDLDGNTLAEAAADGNTVAFAVDPYCIAQVKIYK